MLFKSGTYQIEQLINAGLLEIGDGYRAKNSELSTAGIPFARAANINDGFKFDAADFFPLDVIGKAGNKVSRPGDVVFTSKGTVGRFALVGAGTQRFVYSPQLCFWRSLAQDKLLPEFLYYWMNSDEFLHQISYLKGQTDMADYVSLRDQRKIKATIPVTAIQRSIVDVLKPIDDCIALLRDTNTTLEAIAQVLYKSWFVDYDPVRAKVEGLQPDAMSAETASLFPSSYEESPLGPVPKEWRVSEIGAEVRVVGGGTPSTNEAVYWEGGTNCWATPKDLSYISSPFLLSTGRQITERGVQKISSGLLPLGTVLLSSRAPIGYLAVAQVPVAINQGFIAMICDKALPNYYILNWALENMGTIEGRANGTTFQEISKSNFRPIKIVVPPVALLSRFMSSVEPMYQQVVSNLREVSILIILRDTLLPKLLSGEVRVKDAEKYVGEVA